MIIKKFNIKNESLDNFEINQFATWIDAIGAVVPKSEIQEFVNYYKKIKHMKSVSDNIDDIEKELNFRGLIGNESLISFNSFHLNEEGMATAGNVAGMGNVSSPGVSADGSVNTYSGNGSPTSSAASGSGDRVGRIGGVATKTPAPKFKKSKNRPPKCETIIPFNDFFTTKVTEK